MGISHSPKALETKMRGMSLEFLSNDDFEYISTLKQVDEVFSFLKTHHGYKDIFEGKEKINNREALEQLLMLPMCRSYLKIYHFSSVKEREFLSIYIEKLEVSILKNIFHTILAPREEKENNLPYEEIDFFDKFSCLNLEKLYSCDSLDSFINNLIGTKYYPILKQLLVKREPVPFDLDILLDNFHYLNILKTAKKSLSKKAYEKYALSYGEYIDLTNIAWICRGKRFYEMNEIELYGLILPISSHINERLLRELIMAKSDDEIVTAISHSYYGKYFNADNTKNILASYLKVVDKIIYKAHEKEHGYVPLVSIFFHKKEQEKAKLIEAIEAIRYNINPKDIWK